MNFSAPYACLLEQVGSLKERDCLDGQKIRTALSLYSIDDLLVHLSRSKLVSCAELAVEERLKIMADRGAVDALD